MRADMWLGVVTVLMAVLGGIVSAHAPTKLRHKITYVSAFVLTGAVSIWLVIRISNENAAANRDLAHALADVSTSTTNIASMTALNTDLQQRLLKQNETIADLSKQNIAAVTGGSSFCYVMASPVFSEFGLNITTIGKSPLHDVSVWMLDLDMMKQVVAGKPSLSYEDIQSYTMTFPAIPFLASSLNQMLVKIPIGVRAKRNFQITFSSLNGIWTETLKLEFVNGQWAQALKVGKVVSPVKAGTPNEKLTTPLYAFTTDNFPKKEGKVDWDN